MAKKKQPKQHPGPGRPRLNPVAADAARLGASVRAARIAAGLTVTAAAAAAGMRRERWHEIESGSSIEWLRRAGRVLRVLGCDVEQVFREKD